jgi:uncharacterized membrane protein
MERIKKLFLGLLKIHLPTWLLLTLALVLILRIPSFFEPYRYGDEAIYLTLGQGIRQHIPLYSGLHDNKPPLLYIIAAIAGSLVWFKLILAFWMLVTIVLFWKLSKTFFPKNISFQKLSTIVFAILTTIPLLEGNIANAEIFMLAPTILAFYILLTKKLTSKNLVLGGILFSFASLFKIPAAFDMGAIVAYWLITSGLKAKSIKKTITSSALLAFGFLIPILVTVIWYFFRGAFKEYLIAAFLQNLGYLSSWRSQAQKVPFMVKNGPLLLRGVILLAGSAILFWKRKALTKPFIFFTLWLMFCLFAVTLSERPYPHYLIQAVPAISLLFGILFSQKTKIQTYAVLPLTLAFFVPVYFNFWHYPTISYYQNFLKFAVGAEPKEAYFNYFGPNVQRNYEVASIVNQLTDTKDKVFVWGDDAKIYALSRRLPPIKYVADYHIKDFSSQDEIITKLEKTTPTLIVILPEASGFAKLNTLVGERYIYLSTVKHVGIYKLIDPRVQSVVTP